MSELPPKELNKTFDPAEIEARWYAHWEGEGLFRPDRPDAEPWTIVNPPPNVTGKLHIGHALDNTLQDILVRHARLLGKDALWVVGTDHAGIATQMVVERQLNEHGQKRTDFSREEFVAKVWEWKEESGGEITGQLRRLGCSMDWANERFTMDEGFSRAVTKVFVDLYGEGLIYRDKRLVNWDPGLKTAISDLEVENLEKNSHFWHFSYPLEDGGGAISVATTRPETMLADMAVAVHPDDARYTGLIGRNVRLPITGRLIPIIADEHADPELGSGAVKITPGHDFNDFEVGKRAGFAPAEMLNMLDAEARVVQCGGIPDELLGLDRFDARGMVVEMIEAAGLLERVEDRVVVTPYGDRSNVVIEPWLTDQWYVDAETLAKPAIAAVRGGDIEIVPKSWEKTFFNWMENIQPWCVSRQLWWGHRIPAWYGPKIEKSGSGTRFSGFDVSEGKLPEINEYHVFVACDEDEVGAQFHGTYGADVHPKFCDDWEEYRQWFVALLANANHPGRTGREVPIVRDADVLDTWFSSALWPFATIGWPEDAVETGAVSAEPVEARLSVEKRPLRLPACGSRSGQASTSSGLTGKTKAKPGTDLARHYPNDVLISGFDILFFWDARMMMQGLHFMGEPPWKTLYLHGLVRAADGQKMSKSKGNTADPLELIDKYGADALRFFMAAMESQGRDIKMDEARLAGYRNFATKLWNAARFCQANGIGASEHIEAPEAELPVNRWIISETVETLAKLDKALADLRFDAAADALYHFVWDRFCDWYLELIKPVLGQNAVSPEPVEGRLSAEKPASTSSALTEVEETKSVAGWVLDQILVMLHPFMPFITEELWSKMGDRADYPLITAEWPMADARAMDEEAVKDIGWVIESITQIRSARSGLNIPPSLKLDAYLTRHSVELDELITANAEALKRMCRLIEIHRPWSVDHTSGKLAGSKDDRKIPEGQPMLNVPLSQGEWTLILPPEFDVGSEVARVSKLIASLEKEADTLDKRLSNPQFIEKAKPEAVEKARSDHGEKTAEAERLRAALARLG